MNEKTIFEYENSIGKVTFAYDSHFWISDIRSMSGVDVDVSEARGAQQVGSSITSQNISSRPLTIDGAIFEPLEINREKLIDVIAPGVNSTFTIKENGESWFLDVVPTSTPDISAGNGMQQFQFTIKAPYPHFRSTEYYATQLLGLKALFKFPFYTGGTWWISQFSGDYFKNIVNEGNVPMPFTAVITARGPVINPEVYHVDTGQKIRLLKNMAQGEKFIISTIHGEQGVVFVDAEGVASNGFRFLSTDSDLDMVLLPGSNLIRSDADANRENASVRIEAPRGVRSGV